MIESKFNVTLRDKSQGDISIMRLDREKGKILHFKFLIFI